MFDPRRSHVVVDGLVTLEKLRDLLALETESEDLDFKHKIDLSTLAGELELAKDVGAMRVFGGYLVAGVDSKGQPSGGMDGADMRPFDQASLVSKLEKYLAGPLEISCQDHQLDGHAVVLICVMPSANGCSFFIRDGEYRDEQRDRVRTVFRKDTAFWRSGTRSVQLSADGFEAVMQRREEKARQRWFDEQQEIRRREWDEMNAAQMGRQLAGGALGTVNFDLEVDELNRAVLETVRQDDQVAFEHLLRDAVSRARRLIDADDIEVGLADLLDKLTCLAATLLEYGQEDRFDAIVETLARIYSLPLRDRDAETFGYRFRLDPQEKAPRVWLLILERVTALGSRALRLENWRAIRVLSTQRPARLMEDYDKNWLRHALTMASRAGHFRDESREISLLNLARQIVQRLEYLRPDLDADDDEILTSLARFDLLANVTAVGAEDGTPGQLFFPSWARFRQGRIQPIADRLLSDSELRQELFPLDDAELANALLAIGQVAETEGFASDGFHGWIGTDVGVFIEEHASSGDE